MRLGMLHVVDPIRGAMPLLDDLRTPHTRATVITIPSIGVATLGSWTRSNGQWWSFHRKMRCRGSHLAARIYVNGGGMDHELRFVVYDVRRNLLLAPPAAMRHCTRCGGTRKVRLSRLDVSAFPALHFGRVAETNPSAEVEMACPATGCWQGAMTMYGAANDFRNTPGIETFLPPFVIGDVPTRTLSDRGLYGFTRADVIGVARWCDAVLAALYPRPP